MSPRNELDAEAARREAERIENIEAQIGTDEDGAGGRGRSEPLNQNPAETDPLGGGVERREPIHRSPQDDARMAIAARFRRPEAEERPFNGDLTDNENLYGQHGREGEEIDDDDPHALDPENRQDEADDGIDDQRQAARQRQQEQEPRRREVTVRGKKQLLTDDEILAAAQKTLAGDSYLEEAKALLAEAKTIRAERTGATRQHPDGEMGAHDELDPAEDPSAQHPEPLPVDLVQKLQFGDPEEAAKELAEYIDRRTEKKAANAVKTSGVERAFDQDHQRSQKALKAFTDANPDLANDRIAAMAIEQGMYDLYKEDILKLGFVTEDKLPRTNQELANWHRFYRVNGYEMRNTSDLLEASKGKFLEWRGEKPGQQSQQRTQKTAPRISVSVDRDQRRQAIPLQPSRASAPRRDTTAPVPGDRSAVVANMRKARGQV